MIIYGYIKNGDTSVIYYEGNIRLDNPHITEDQTGDSFPYVEGYEPIYQEIVPPYAEDETFDLLPIVKEDDKWVMKYAIRKLNAEELKQMEDFKLSLQPKENQKAGSKPNAL